MIRLVNTVSSYRIIVFKDIFNYIEDLEITNDIIIGRDFNQYIKYNKVQSFFMRL